MDEQTRKMLIDMGNLFRETARLRADVIRLREIFQPADDSEWNTSLPSPPYVRTPEEALDMLDIIRGGVRGCEYHLSAIRNLLSDLDRHTALEIKGKFKK